ncbi:hypothetical protein L1049_004062 [Liquidambar formosana]|uniref:Uncharacterized protein n=1 Tax=Liquidambar formosana TaxID=63359 RepID=A0AAP0X0G5_LIQFO
MNWWTASKWRGGSPGFCVLETFRIDGKWKSCGWIVTMNQNKVGRPFVRWETTAIEETLMLKCSSSSRFDLCISSTPMKFVQHRFLAFFIRKLVGGFPYSLTTFL